MALRVLHVVHDYLPTHQAGSELYVEALCLQLRALGHHPVVFAASFAPGRPHRSFEWRAHAGVPVVELVNNWEAAGFPETYDAMWLQGAFARVLDAVEPHAVHVHNLLNLSFSLPAAARSRGIPVVATLHDYTLVCPSGGQRVHRSESFVCRRIDPSRCARCFTESPFHAQWQFGRTARTLPGGSARRMAARAARIPVLGRAGHALARSVGASPIAAGDIERRLEAAREAFRQFQRVVAPSRSLAEEFRGLGFPVDRIEVSDYGFAPIERLRRSPPPTGRLRAGFIGTLVWHKGPDVLVEAVRLLPRDRIRASIHGDEHVFPDYVRDLRARADGLPVDFHGRFEHADAGAVLAGLDVLVVPSRWLENSPLVIHEAFMAGVPVIASDIGGMRELLGHGRHGLLVAPDDPAALAGALSELLDSPQRLRELGEGTPAVKTIADDAAEWVARYESAVRDTPARSAAT